MEPCEWALFVIRGSGVGTSTNPQTIRHLPFSAHGLFFLSGVWINGSWGSFSSMYSRRLGMFELENTKHDEQNVKKVNKQVNKLTPGSTSRAANGPSWPGSAYSRSVCAKFPCPLLVVRSLSLPWVLFWVVSMPPTTMRVDRETEGMKLAGWLGK